MASTKAFWAALSFALREAISHLVSFPVELMRPAALEDPRPASSRVHELGLQAPPLALIKFGDGRCPV